MSRVSQARSLGKYFLLVDNMLVVLGFFVVFPLISIRFVDQMGWAALMVGIALGLRQLVQQGLGIFGGAIADRFGAKPMIVTGMLMRAGGFAAMAVAHEPWVLWFSCILSGLGGTLFDPPRAALVVKLVRPHQRGRFFSILMMQDSAGAVIGALLGSWLLVHFEWQAIFATLFAITLLLMLPALRLKAAAKSVVVTQQKITFLALLRSREYSGNVLIYAACSASFFAWLTGSPFILHEMGYGPTAIGLSYIPQTIAFLVGGYGCRAVLQKWSGQQMLPWLLVIFAVSVAATWLVGLQTHASLVALMIPFCMMAVVNGGIYPIVVAQALKPFPQATGRAAALQNTLQLGLCFLTSLLVSALIATPLLTTTSVMLVSIGLAGIGYRLQQTPELTPHSSHA